MKPLLLLDIDGVICPFGTDDDSHLEPIPGHGYARIDRKHTAWLRELSDLYRPVWASMWESGGNEVIAPVHELEPWPFIPFMHSFNLHDRTPKLQAVKQFVEDEPFAWVEDDLFDDAFKWASKRNNMVPTRLVQTDPKIGLDEAVMTKLRHFGYTFANS